MALLVLVVPLLVVPLLVGSPAEASSKASSKASSTASSKASTNASTKASTNASTKASTKALTSTGAGLTKQTVTVDVPGGWRLSLDHRAPQYTDTVLVPQGFYTQDSPTLVTFTPNIGFLGPAAPVTLRLTGPKGQTTTETYAATVILPPEPATPHLTSSGPAQTRQQVGFDLPAGSIQGYADPDRLKIPQGTFEAAAISGIATVPGRPFDPTLISARGFLIFTPNRGFSGVMPTVRYRITDAYGQSSVGTWTPTVTGY